VLFSLWYLLTGTDCTRFPSVNFFRLFASFYWYCKSIIFASVNFHDSIYYSILAPWNFAFLLGTCEASRYDSNSNRTIPIRFESEGLIQNFQIHRTCSRTTNHAHCSTKNFNRCAVVTCNWDYFMSMNTWYDHYIYNYFTTKHVVG